jgi:hypothetical protein
MLVSEKLGISLRASTPTEKRVQIIAGQTERISFGLMDSGFVSGRVFNDTDLSGKAPAYGIQGLAGIRIIFRPFDGLFKPTETRTESGGTYQFPNVRPGQYILEMDPQTLPLNFEIPKHTVWEITVAPLAGFYLDIPIQAQRAIAGVVYIDNDGDNRYDPSIDAAVSGARVTCGQNEGVADQSGAYILRNLPAGKLSVVATLPDGRTSKSSVVELTDSPMVKRLVNLAILK